MMPPGDQMQRSGRQMALEWGHSLRVNSGEPRLPLW